MKAVSQWIFKYR